MYVLSCPRCLSWFMFADPPNLRVADNWKKRKYYFKNECECFITISKHEKTDESMRPSASIVFECLEIVMKHDARVFEITSLSCVWGCVRLGNSDFGFPNKTRNPKNGFRLVEILFQDGFQLRGLNWNPSLKRISAGRNRFLDFAFYWEIRNTKSKSGFPNRTHPE